MGTFQKKQTEYAAWDLVEEGPVASLKAGAQPAPLDRLRVHELVRLEDVDVRVLAEEAAPVGRKAREELRRQERVAVPAGKQTNIDLPTPYLQYSVVRSTTEYS